MAETEKRPAERLNDLRNRAAMSLNAVAQAVGLKGASSVQRYFDPTATPGHVSIDFIARLAPHLAGKGTPPIQISEVYEIAGTDGKRMLEETREAASDEPPSDVRPAPDAPALARNFPMDVEVRGIAAAGDGGEFSFNGEVIERAARWPGIATQRYVTAIRVVGTSMSPWREPGQLVYFSDRRDPNVGDYVIVELKPTRNGEPGPAYLKRLVSRSSKEIRLAQYNPKRDDIRFKLSDVKGLYRVIDWPELGAM